MSEKSVKKLKAKTNKDFSPGGSRCVHELVLPAGLRCVLITEGTTAGKYFLDEFPEDIFATNSMVRHDAEHYGVIIEAEEVE